MKIRPDYTCPLEIITDIMKGKWKTIILYQLKRGTKSLSQLEKGIQGINQKMLLEQLKELKQFGLVQKKSYEGYPLRVEYSLTEERGKKMLDALDVMQQIGIDYMIENGREEELKEKGVLLVRAEDTHKKVGNGQLKSSGLYCDHKEKAN